MKIVREDEEIFGGDFVEIREVEDGGADVVIKSLGLEKDGVVGF